MDSLEFFLMSGFACLFVISLALYLIMEFVILDRAYSSWIMHRLVRFLIWLSKKMAFI